MEVVSPLTLSTSATGTKRSLACSPQVMGANNCPEQEFHPDETLSRMVKRRRFNADTAMESLAEHFSTYSPFFSKSLPMNKPAANSKPAQAQKRNRGSTSSPTQETLNRVIDEQAGLIESLKADKSNLESSLTTMKADHERVLKENQILRRAVAIQQDRHKQTLEELKGAQEQRASADAHVKRLEQMVLTLRYHMQAQHPSVGNDFMHMSPRPPDVF